MAVSTTTTMNDITYAAIIEPVFMDYAHDWVVTSPFLRQFDARGRGSAAIDIPNIDSNMGTVGDAGSGVDTEFDATQATDLTTTTTLSTSKVTLTAVEFGVRSDITDNVFEDSISGLDLLNRVVSNAARILMTAWEDDVCAQFVSFTNLVGSSGLDLTIAQMLSAQVGIRKRGIRLPDGVVYVLDEQQADDVEAAMIATSTSAASYALAGDRLLGIDKSPNHGLGNGHVFTFRGYPVFATGLTDTAQAGANVVGACFGHSTPGNDPMCALGQVNARNFRMGTQRDESARSTEFVATMRRGVGILLNGSGTEINSDF